MGIEPTSEAWEASVRPLALYPAYTLVERIYFFLALFAFYCNNNLQVFSDAFGSILTVPAYFFSHGRAHIRPRKRAGLWGLELIAWCGTRLSFRSPPYQRSSVIRRVLTVRIFASSQDSNSKSAYVTCRSPRRALRLLDPLCSDA
jgi:hypothetical protein